MDPAERGVGPGDLRYGPATAELKELLDRAVHTTGEQRAALDDADRLCPPRCVPDAADGARLLVDQIPHRGQAPRPAGRVRSPVRRRDVVPG